MSYSIGNDLRELPDDIEEYKKGIGYLKEQLEHISDLEKRARCLSMLGVFNRVIGNFDASWQQLKEADTLLSKDLNERLKLVNQLRMAQTLQFQEEHQKAESIYSRLEEYINKHLEYRSLLDFVYQHKGKNYYEQGQLQKALHFIEAAFQIRLEKKEQDLIESSQFAIDVIKKAIHKYET